MKFRKITASVPIEAKGMMMYIISTGLSFLIGVMLVRNLGSEMYGKYAYVLAWFVLATSFVTGGLPTLLIREITVYRDRRQYELIGGIIRVATIFVTLFSGLLIVGFLLAITFGKILEWDLQIIVTVLFAFLFLCWSTVFESVIRGFGYILIGQLSNKILRPTVQFFLLSILVFGLYGEPLTTKTALYAFMIAALFNLLFTVFILKVIRRNHGSFLKRYDFNRWYSSYWRISSGSWIGVLNLQLSVILLGILGDETEVARYKVATQIAMLVPFGLQVMSNIQMPILSKAYNSGDKIELQRLASRSCIISFITAFPILFITILFGDGLIPTIFGSEYQDVGIILYVLMFGQLVNVITGSSGLLLLVLRNEQTFMIIQTAVLLLNSALCIILIPRMGAMGAAIASAISLSLMNICLVSTIYCKIGIVSLPVFYKKK